ncbi:uncharacterized protein LOC108160942 [Drosophila miranda]|uniref:uncharacterized protein LOC108160942 n=1 Tax=Drosophila miranda TaxID=7229 RepID=UPI0007E8619F|nr:uncharacterized protein LOC108160942 [Drosophila miranda]
MPADFLALLNSRDSSLISSNNPIINDLVKPMSLELSTAVQLIVKTRRQRMQELFAQEYEWKQEELSRLGLSRINDTYNCCTPDGLRKVKL